MNMIIGGAIVKLYGSEVDLFKRVLRYTGTLSGSSWFENNHSDTAAVDYVNAFKGVYDRFSNECRATWDPDKYSITFEEPYQVSDMLIVVAYLYDYNHMIPEVGGDKPLTEFLRALKGLLYPLVHQMRTDAKGYAIELKADEESRDGKVKSKG